MQTRLETAVTYDEARLLVQALKRFELSEGETDESRLLVARFRRMRDEMRPDDAPDDAETQAEIFAAGVLDQRERVEVCFGAKLDRATKSGYEAAFEKARAENREFDSLVISGILTPHEAAVARLGRLQAARSKS